ncbi:MAG: DUF2249 domain-containing protein [Phycisphaerales bacterium]|nr:DUF2249 domain-containing protein [Phycisphaerales bacterium]
MTTNTRDGAQVTADMTLAAFLASSPDAAGALASIAPAFAGLNDPVLREQVGRTTTLGRVAKAAGVAAEDLIARLRARLGLPSDGPVLRSLPQAPSACGCSHTPIAAPAAAATPAAPATPAATPPWASSGEPVRVIDADEVLGRGESPLGPVLEAARALAPGEVLAVRAAFRPTPLIQRLQGDGHATHCRPSGDGRTELLITPG